MTDRNDERLRVAYPVIVEGKYDRLRLSSVIEATILTTDGFGIFKQDEKRALFRALAAKTPLIVLTDSDGAGKVIRSSISAMIPRDRLIQLYIPRVAGKERRKKTPSAEGTLGVEGMDRDLLRTLFAPYAVGQAPRAENPVSKTDFYIDGLTGQAESKARRDALAQSLGLPPNLTPNALLAAVKLICTYEEYKEAVKEITAVCE